MTIVYALAAPTAAIYPAMALISAISARRANPGLGICLFTDQETRQALQSCRHGLLEAVDEVIVRSVPTRNPALASRFLKTSAALTIGGPILLLDCDTLVRGDLSSVLKLPVDVAAAPNHSADTWLGQAYAGDLAMLQALGWEPRSDAYLNTGVVFWGGSHSARRLAARWHELWCESQRQLGVHNDQPSFNALVSKLGDELQILPHRFNGQFRVRPQAADGAVIWHYYSSDTGAPTTAFERLAARVAQGNTIAISEVAALADGLDPWSGNHFLDRFVARRALRDEVLGTAERAWFEGRRRAALDQWGTNLLSALKRGWRD